MNRTDNKINITVPCNCVPAPVGQCDAVVVGGGTVVVVA